LAQEGGKEKPEGDCFAQRQKNGQERPLHAKKKKNGQVKRSKEIGTIKRTVGRGAGKRENITTINRGGRIFGTGSPMPPKKTVSISPPYGAITSKLLSAFLRPEKGPTRSVLD